MFVQVIQGQVGDAGGGRQALDRWVEELAPGATGWLGSTAGVTDDGRFIAIARFESEDAARRNSERTEQDQWWTQTSKLFTGEPTFRDSTEVDVDMVGDPDRAGFVQVIQGRSSDPARARELMSQDQERGPAFRPDILGSLGIGHEDGEYTAVAVLHLGGGGPRGRAKERRPSCRSRWRRWASSRSASRPSSTSRTPWLHSPG